MRVGRQPFPRATEPARGGGTAHGDTLFHGYWWRIARAFGPFDRVFLPINGAVVDFRFLQPRRGLEARMTPEEAARAGPMLGARSLPPATARSPAVRLCRNRRSGGQPGAAGKERGIGIDIREPGSGWISPDQ